MESIDVFAPLASLQWVDRNTIHANDYNPNQRLDTAHRGTP